MFTPATKQKEKLRLALTGTSGAGKTYTALEIARQLGTKVAFVDTEHRSSRKYADKFKFDVVDVEAPFHPQKYIDAIKGAEAEGYDVIILDSLTHAWTGEGGILSIVNGITSSSSHHNSMVAWNDAGTPLYDALVNAITRSDIHIIGTVRSKQKHVVEDYKDKNGAAKKKLTRIGVKPIQREDFEFEFDLVFDMSLEHSATVTKTRFDKLPMGMVIPKPGAGTGKMLREWLEGDGIEWIEATSDRAVSYAAEAWKVSKESASRRINEAVASESVRGFLPKTEFKEWVGSLRVKVEVES